MKELPGAVPPASQAVATLPPRCQRCGIVDEVRICPACEDAPDIPTGWRLFDVLWGVGQAFGQKDLKAFAVLPVVIAILILVLGLWWSFGSFNYSFHQWMLAKLPPGFIGFVLDTLSTVLSALAGVIVFSFLFLPLVGLICMPFLDPLVARLESRLLGQRPAARIELAQLLPEIGRLTLFKIALLLPAFLLAGIPLFGPLIYTGALVLTMSLDFLDIIWMRRGYSFHEKRHFLKNNLSAWLLYLFPLLLMVWLPLLQLLILPGAAAGAVRFYLASKK